MTMRAEDNPMGPVIVRVLAGTSTAEDDAGFARWLADDPRHQEEVEDLRRIWGAAATLQRDWDTTSLQQRILRIPDARSPVGATEPRFGAWLVRRRHISRSLAAAVVLVVAGTIIWTGDASRRASVTSEGRLTEIATRRGQQASLRLADGTRITLGVDSRLRYPESFTTGAGREIYLEGEAYFDVARDSAHPFTVHAGGAVTRVLGTRFGVRAYAENREVRVVVAEGKVALRQRTAEVVLNVGDRGVAKNGGAPSVEHGVDVSSYLAWVDGRLVFIDTPVSEVVQQVSRWYNLDVRLGDRLLADVPFTMSLRGDEAPAQVLAVIAAAVNGRLEQRGTAYVILGKVVDVP